MSKPTDTNQASELFELCKEVYELTGWDGTDKCRAYLKNPYVDVWDWETIPCHEDNVVDVDEWYPLYTSDYLLDKLLPITSIQLKSKANGDIRLFYFPEKPDYATYDYDTPLKCLLALTIALSEAGELK